MARKRRTGGTRKYECRDCGQTFMASWRVTWETKTNVNRCPACGSTFIDPYSRGAYGAADERIGARDNLPPLRDFDSAEGRKT